jgi:hypothetical protein
MTLQELLDRITDYTSDIGMVNYTIEARVRDLNSNYLRLVRKVNFLKGKEWTNTSADTNVTAAVLTAATGLLTITKDSEIDRVEAEGLNGWVKLKKFVQEDYSGSYTKLQDTDGEPEFYLERDGNIEIFPKPVADTAIRIFQSDEPTQFTQADLAFEPRLSGFSHEILAIQSSMDYYSRMTEKVPKKWLEDEADILADIEKIYAPTRVIKIKQKDIVDRPL